MQASSKSFYTNTSALFVLQIANYILPFVLIPYLTRVLGIYTFGIVAFGLAMNQIANIITDFGFNLSATYTIAKNREDKKFINQVIGAVFVSKIGLLLLILTALSFYIVFQQKYEEYRSFFFLMMFSIIGQTFQPVWFFQGIERMIFITLYTVATRILYVVLVVLMVNNAQAFYWVAIGNGIAQISAAILSIFMIYKLGYRIVIPHWPFVKKVFLDSKDFFWSRAAVATYSAGGVFFLGLVAIPSETAYYSAAEQLYKGAKALFDPINLALYPYMTKHKNMTLFLKVIVASIILSILGVLIGFIYGPEIIETIFGKNFENTYPILKVFLITFLFTTPSVLLGYPLLGALGLTKLANRSVIIAGIIQISILMIYYFSDIKTGQMVVYSVLFVEIIVLFLRLFWSKKYFTFNENLSDFKLLKNETA